MPGTQSGFRDKAQAVYLGKVFGKNVEVVPVDEDRCERKVAEIYIDGKCLNQMIVDEGPAWLYKSYATKDFYLKEASDCARSTKKGFWSHPNPVPPWEFRRNKAPSSGKAM